MLRQMTVCVILTMARKPLETDDRCDTLIVSFLLKIISILWIHCWGEAQIRKQKMPNLGRHYSLPFKKVRFNGKLHVHRL